MCTPKWKGQIETTAQLGERILHSLDKMNERELAEIRRLVLRVMRRQIREAVQSEFQNHGNTR
jgi:hypothetical protein